MFDVFFISFGERGADEHWALVQAKTPYARWIANVQGIRAAHVKAAQQSSTEYFWVVDADSEVLPEFNFDISVSRKASASYFFHSRNPLNGLEYGHGGIKLLNKFKVLRTSEDYFDFTTSITLVNQVLPVVGSIHRFNESEFATWKCAFRECVKLSSKLIPGQNTQETEDRLHVWTTVAEGDFAEYCLQGARAGVDFYNQNIGSKEKLKLINNFSWLEENFREGL